MRAISYRQAGECETAKTRRCRCRCGGLLHGAGRTGELPLGDPHNPKRAALDPALAVAQALAPDALVAILARWEAVNPHQAGAHASDVLDMLTDADSDLDLIEAIPADQWPEHPAAGHAARAVIWGRPLGALRILIPDELAGLLARVAA